MDIKDMLSSHLLSLYRDGRLVDVRVTWRGQTVCEAHQVVLSAFSPVLSAQLLASHATHRVDQQQVKVLDVAAAARGNVSLLVSCMYTGELQLAGLSSQRLASLRADAHALGMTATLHCIDRHTASAIITVHDSSIAANSSAPSSDQNHPIEKDPLSGIIAQMNAVASNNERIALQGSSSGNEAADELFDHRQNTCHKCGQLSAIHNEQNSHYLKKGTQVKYASNTNVEMHDKGVNTDDTEILLPTLINVGTNLRDVSESNGRHDTELDTEDYTSQGESAHDTSVSSLLDNTTSGEADVKETSSSLISDLSDAFETKEELKPSAERRKRSKPNRFHDTGAVKQRTIKVTIKDMTTGKRKRGRPRKIKIVTDEEPLLKVEEACVGAVKEEQAASAADDSGAASPTLPESSPLPGDAGAELPPDAQSSDPELTPELTAAQVKARKQRVRRINKLVLKKTKLKTGRKAKYSDEDLLACLQADGDYKCPECERAVTELAALRTHIKREHAARRHQCQYCAKTFRDRFKLTEHERVHTNERPFSCPVCSRAFKAKKTLAKHLKIHNENERLPCTFEGCKATFSSKDHVERHIRGVHLKLKRFFCHVEGCGYGSSEHSDIKTHFRNKHGPQQERTKELCTVCGAAVLGGSQGLRAHMVQHSDVRHKCDFCSFKTKYKNHLQDHVTRRHGVNAEGKSVEKNFVCPRCPFTCYFKYEFNFHLRKHEPEKPHKCPVCEFRALTPFILKVHMRSHTGEKPYKCSYCHKSFAQSTQLVNHRRTHTGEKPHKCTTCDQGFSTKRYLDRHFFSTHLGCKPFVCHICPYNCVKKETLHHHIVSSHGAESLPPDMIPKKKKIIKLHDLSEEQQMELVGYVSTRHKCLICACPCGGREALRAHIVAQHGEAALPEDMLQLTQPLQDATQEDPMKLRTFTLATEQSLTEQGTTGPRKQHSVTGVGVNDVNCVGVTNASTAGTTLDITDVSAPSVLGPEATLTLKPEVPMLPPPIVLPKMEMTHISPLENPKMELNQAQLEVIQIQPLAPPAHQPQPSHQPPPAHHPLLASEIAQSLLSTTSGASAVSTSGVALDRARFFTYDLSNEHFVANLGTDVLSVVGLDVSRTPTATLAQPVVAPTPVMSNTQPPDAHRIFAEQPIYHQLYPTFNKNVSL